MRLLPETESDRRYTAFILRVDTWKEQSREMTRQRDETRKKENKRKTKLNNQHNTRKYRATRVSAPISDLTISQWEFVLKAHNYTCWYCLKHYDNLTQDHIVPLSKGGNHTQDNVVPACKSCNSEKGNKSLQEYFESICGKW